MTLIFAMDSKNKVFVFNKYYEQKKLRKKFQFFESKGMRFCN